MNLSQFKKVCEKKIIQKNSSFPFPERQGTFNQVMVSSPTLKICDQKLHSRKNFS